jgi:hypothetical protein
LIFLQDYESIFYPHSSDLVEVLECYDVPHFAIFSTPMLAQFFKHKKIGVYRGGDSSLGDARSFAAMPAIKPFTAPRYALLS